MGYGITPLPESGRGRSMTTKTEAASYSATCPPPERSSTACCTGLRSSPSTAAATAWRQGSPSRQPPLFLAGVASDAAKRTATFNAARLGSVKRLFAEPFRLPTPIPHPPLDLPSAEQRRFGRPLLQAKELCPPQNPPADPHSSCQPPPQFHQNPPIRSGAL